MALRISRQRLGSMGAVHVPPRLIHEPTMRASAPASMSSLALFGVTPEPTRRGKALEVRTSLTSPGLVALPVAVPVTISPSAPKNSAASAASESETSAVIACEACFFLRSQKIWMCSAPIIRR